MDQETRNKLQRATQQIRRLLEEDFAEQLEGTFDILPSGRVFPKPGKHLDAQQRLTRQKLVEAIEHIKAGGKTAKEAVEEHTRETAFTFLNRFVALRMLESRGMLQECVSKGDQSNGFKEFCGLAPGLTSLPDGGFRLYLECLFDELSVEVKVLFDRRDRVSSLWPRRAALTELLDILAQRDLAKVWSEDETIGWVYQYFNGDEERTKMRAESPAPRNSRELAVRNQFFTPRYVVRFLTDNTLGRTWYEMMQGETKLAYLDYLMRRPNEVFLGDGEAAPESEMDDIELSQEELFQQSVYVPFRPKKDPRDLRILDPACGSGHFLLYAFDLLVSIYEEAWGDAGATAFTGTGTRLRDDYGSVDELRRAMPEFILRHNLHGVDIDPRAAQIAALALWMRAQRAYDQFGVNRTERPPITKTNIVVAEPMPDDAELVDEFAASLKPALLGNLFKKMIQEMKLAGELGSLLTIEESIAKAVKDAEETHRQDGLFAEKIESKDFWGTADEKIISALESFAESAVGSFGIRRQLFAGDAGQGVAFIELMRKRFDAILMNPPFGEPSIPSRTEVYRSSPSSKADLGAAFLGRCSSLLSRGGLLGILKSRALLFHDKLENWRKSYFLGGCLSAACVADLGYGVLDAVVEVDAAVLLSQEGDSASFFSCLASQDKETLLLDAIAGRRPDTVYVHRLRRFDRVPLSKLVYFVSNRWLDFFQEPSESSWFVSKAGLASGSDERLVRAYWEVPALAVAQEKWWWFAKGGEFGRYTTSLHLVIRWGRPDLFRRPGDTKLYGQPGVTYSERTTSNLSVRILNKKACFSYAGPAVLPIAEDELSYLLLVLNSFFVTYLVEAVSGAGDHSARGTAARHFYPSYFERIRIPKPKSSELAWFTSCAKELIDGLRQMQLDETEIEFAGFDLTQMETIHQWACWIERSKYRILERLYRLIGESEERISAILGLSVEEVLEGFSFTGWPWPNGERPCQESIEFISTTAPFGDAKPNLPGRLSKLRFLNKLSHYLSPAVETAAHCWDLRPEQLCQIGSRSYVPTVEHIASLAQMLLQWTVGVSFGRFDVRAVTGLASTPSESGPFEQLPTCSPGMLTSDDGLPIRASADDYPLSFPSDGIFVDDQGHSADLVSRTRSVFEEVFEQPEARWHEAAELLETRNRDLRTWFAKDFFDFHIKQYSKSRRKAPIYWQLATPSASYSVWLYYHRFTRDTFFQALNDYVKPKLKHERQKLDRERSEAGADPTRSQCKEIEDQERIVAELASMVEEVERIAPLWNPNLNDGVIVNFAPLWRLVPQNKSWQKECKTVWDKLVKGDYDWAHLAMHLWPERVVPKCHEDRSLAIAHDIEKLLWVEDGGKWRPIEDPDSEIDEQRNRRSSEAFASFQKAMASLAKERGDTLSAAQAWRHLSEGDWDDTGVAMLLWPRRVVTKCFTSEDDSLAKRHNITERTKNGTKPVEPNDILVERLVDYHEKFSCPRLLEPLERSMSEAEGTLAAYWAYLSRATRDYSELSLLLWPDRIMYQCTEDIDVAEAKGMRDFFWVQEKDGEWRRRLSPEEEIQQEVARRHNPAVKAALQSLLEAPTPTSGSGKSRRRRSAGT